MLHHGQQCRRAKSRIVATAYETLLWRLESARERERVAVECSITAYSCCRYDDVECVGVVMSQETHALPYSSSLVRCRSSVELFDQWQL